MILGPHIVSIFVTSIALLTTAVAEISFNFEIRPILSKNCIACHGPDEGDRKGDVRLDTFAGATTDLGGYAPIVPFKPETSKLLKLVTTTDQDDIMPPPDHGNPLSEKDISLLRKWIEQGAKYETHWSFAPLVRPELPVVTGAKPNSTPIDLFVLQKLHAVGLTPSAPAKPTSLLRRLSLDLIGLPPSLPEAERFAQAFAQNPEAAYERAVDHLLSSPAYGEHWASMWLDIARYADTVGYTSDEHRDIWPWRDWVIQAYNDNMPYDQFIIEQVAGDLLPNPTNDQILATAFHRLTLSNNEGGTNDEEFRTVAVKDRVSTTVNAFMGLTMRCAECHSHKYDPISMKEYYQFYDFFNQTEDADKRDDSPKKPFYPKGREKETASLKARIAALRKTYNEARDNPWLIWRPENAIASGGVELTLQDDGSLLAGGQNAKFPTYTLTSPLPQKETRSLRLELIPDLAHNEKVGRSPDGATVMTEFKANLIAPDGKRTPLQFAKAVADYSQPNHHIERVIKKKPDKLGWAIKHPDYDFRTPRTAIFDFANPLPNSPGHQLELQLVYEGKYQRMGAGRIRLSTTSVSNAATKYEQRKLDPIARDIAELERQLQPPVRVPIAVELPKDKQRDTHLMTRGSFLQLGEKVTSEVPKAFAPFPDNAPKNRLGVARWMTSPENPLTARVAVNRYWARLFGIGIVESEEDFGTQGLLPSHPELLDWLAVEFRDSGWDRKALLKKLVMTQTYRQSAIADPEKLEKDPRNILLSRGSRHRLAAEVVRDQALTVSGLLTRKLYGQPVYPPSPIKHFANAFSKGTTWVDSTGPDRYRRAIYTYLKRSNPHPLFETFDMASRDVCVLRRLRTNTPLQSFMTLNDVVFVEASQALARKMADYSEDPMEQIQYGLQLILLDAPDPSRAQILLQLYHETFPEFESDPKNAAKMAGNDSSPSNAVRLATLTVVANVMLNLDGFLCK